MFWSQRKIDNGSKEKKKQNLFLSTEAVKMLPRIIGKT